MAVSAYICGEAVGAAGGPLVIPITADVPRSDPLLGLSAVLVFYTIVGDYDAVAVADDATPEDLYSYCLFADGLNHYSQSGTEPIPGVIANDLVAGVNSLTLTTSGGAGPTWIHAFAVALTGAHYTVSGSGPLFGDPTLPLFIDALLNLCQTPPGGPGAISLGPAAIIDSFGGITFPSPLGATDTTWGWSAGDLALYVLDGPTDADHGGWTWADGTIADLYQYDFPGGGGQRQGAVGLATPALLAAGPSLNGVWGDATFGGVVHGFAFTSGAGPGPCSSPPSGTPAASRIFPV